MNADTATTDPESPDSETPEHEAEKPQAAGSGLGSGSLGDERLAFRGPIQTVLTRPEIGAMLGVAAVWMLFWLTSEAFGTAGGTANYLDVAAIFGIMAVPVALLMIGGEFDLSAGSMTGATAMLVVLLSKEVGEFGGAGLHLHLAVPLVFAFALLVGWFNGTMVEKTSLPSFIVTLGTFFILIGAKLSFSKLFTDKVIVEGLDEAGGYRFWNDFFGAVWIRNNHPWDGRDWAWAILLIAGGAGLLISLLDLTFKHRENRRAKQLGVFAVGTAIGVAGMIGLLVTDGSASDWAFSGVIGAGVLSAVAGWCGWRYERAEHHSGTLSARVRVLTGAGVAAAAAAAAVAALMDAYDESELDYLGGAAGRALFLIGIAAMGVLAVLAAQGKVSQAIPAVGAAVAAVPAASYLVTVQAARAILFVALALAGVLLLGAAARAARPASASAALAISLLMSVMLVLLALFIRSEGDSRKIRVEVMAGVLLVSLALASKALATFLAASRDTASSHADMGTWTRWAAYAGAAGAVVAAIFEFGDFGPAILDAHAENGIAYTLLTSVVKGGLAALAVYAVGVIVRIFASDDDGIGRALAAVSLAALALGLAAKLLFITTLEAEATTAVTRFRVSVLYYLAFAGVGAWMLVRTRFGSWTFAVGGNKEASRSVGVPAAHTKTTLFMLVSSAAFVAGMLTAFRLNSVQSNVGDGNEFRYIIMAVVGGCLLTGGYGSAAGAAIGALIWGMITQGIGFAGWNTDWRFLVLGFLLLVSVILNNYVRARAERMT